MQDYAPGFDDIGDFIQREDYAAFIVGVHDGNDGGILSD